MRHATHVTHVTHVHDRRAHPGGRIACLAAVLAIVAAAVFPAAGAAPSPAAVDLSGDGAVEDSVGFGVYGASVEVTVWASSGIAAGPLSLTSGAGGAYNWSFSQVPDGSLLNLTVRAWLPWDTNTSAQAVFDLTNGSAPTDYPGVVLSLAFVANESVSLVAPTGEVVVPRGRNATVAFDLQVTGNTAVAHGGPLLLPATGNLTVQLAPGAGPDARLPGESFQFNATLRASGSAGPENTSVTVQLPSLSGANLSAQIAVRIVLNRQAAIVSVGTQPAPPREGEAASIVVRVANLGADFAPAAAVHVSAHNATVPSLYSNTTATDLPPGGATLNVTFGWTPPWSADPVTLVASVFTPDDWDPADDSLNATVSIESTNLPPAVTFSSPADGARLAGNVTVAGTVSDPEGGPLSTDFAVDGQAPFLTVGGGLFGFVWDLSPLPDGPHTLSATATDSRGDNATAAVTVVVLNRGPNAPPSVSVAAPADGDVVAGPVWVNGTATDERGELGSVLVSVDGGPDEAANGTADWSFLWDAAAAGEGTHALRVEAFDGIDRSAPVFLNLTVNLTAPAALSLSGVTILPAIVQPNGQMQVAGTVRFDTGVLAAGAEVSGNLRGFAAVGAAAADGRGRFAFTLPAPSSEGDFVLDVNVRVGNLTGAEAFPVRVARGSAPDLEVTPSSFSVSPDPPLANRTVQHTVDLRNLGPVAANATLRVWDESGAAPLLIYEWAFSITSQRQASFEHTYAAGLHNLTVRIEDVSPPDVDLSNNELVVALRVHSLPDFVMVSLTPSRNDPQAGQNISFLAVIANIGEAGGTVSFELWDGPPAAANSTRFYQQAVALLPGDNERVVASWTAVEGAHEVHALLVLAQPQELNITNNGASVRVDVTGPPPPDEPVFLPGLGGAGALMTLLAAGGVARRRRGKRPVRARRGGRRDLLLGLAIVLALLVALAPSPAGARLEDAGVVPGPLNGVCATCHVDPNGGPDLNAFGADYGAERNATGGAVDLNRLGALDSDGDGFANAAEWQDGYLPGDPGSNPATGVRYAGFTGSGITSGAVAAVVLIAMSLLGTWLGYRMLKGRTARAQRKADEAEGGQPPAP